MVVGYDPSKKERYQWITSSLSGAASGCVTRASVQPLDVIKIRFQIQDDPFKCSHEVKYRGVWQTMGKIFADEGLHALWKGHVPAQFLSILYGLVQFSCFEALTKLTYSSTTTSTIVQPLNHFVCGSISGIAATSLSYPFDVVRTRLIIQGHPRSYNSMSEAFKIIISKEGAHGLFKGFVPTLVQIAPNIGFQFAFYRFATTTWDLIEHHVDQTSSPNKATGIIKSMICGSLAGLGAKTATYPLDFAKKRMQMKGFHSYGNSVIGSQQNYIGLFHCLATVIRHEGLLAVYKGLVPSMLKAVSTSALIFCTYEQFLRVFSAAYTKFNES